MGVATVQMPDTQLASRPSSPKLGNFSRVFDQLAFSSSPPAPSTWPAEGVAEGRHGLFLTPPARLSASQTFVSGLFSGLDLSDCFVQDTPAICSTPPGRVSSDEDSYEACKASASSISETSSTAGSSPPRSLHDVSFHQPLTHRPSAPAASQNSPYNTVVLDHLIQRKTSASIPKGIQPPSYPGQARLHRSPPNANHHVFVPRYLSSKTDRLRLLKARLAPQYDLDTQAEPTRGVPFEPIHIFVDLSNIIIGFYDCLKTINGISLNQKVKAPPFFFEAFTTILERDRPVGRKVVAGSVPDNSDRSRWPVYMQEAETAGYEMNILSRVNKATLTPKASTRKGHKSQGGGWHTSDAYSSDDAVFNRYQQPKMAEQAVDEILHLKMCHSLIDHDPGTIVLATGDAAAAEFSDGFLKHVERALARGWCVELLSWKGGISSAWRNLQRNREWGHRFRIIELDYFVDELFGVFTDDENNF